MSLVSAVALVLLAQTTTPYVRSRVDTGVKNDPKAPCLYWKGGNIPWVQSQAGSEENAGDTEFTEVAESFSTWQQQAAACGNFTLVEGARSSRRLIEYDPAASDNVNLVLFRTSRCADRASGSDTCWQNADCNNKFDCWQYASGTIALTTTTYDKASGLIYDADLELNDWGFVFTTVDSPQCPSQSLADQTCVATDLQNTVTHEVGHMLGLDHASDLDSTMFASAPLGETKKRSLDNGSKQFVCDVYAKGTPSKSCVVLKLESDLGPAATCAAAPVGPLLALSLLALRRRHRT